MDIIQNRNLKPAAPYPLKTSIKATAVQSFKGRLPFNNLCHDVFVKEQPKVSTLRRNVFQQVKEKTAEKFSKLKGLLSKQKKVLDFSNFENKDVTAEFEGKGLRLLSDRDFGGYLFSGNTAKSFLELLEQSKNLTLESPLLMKDYSSKAVYDFPTRFAIAVLNTFQKKGSANIIEKIPPVFDGLNLKNGTNELFEKLDMLPSLLDKYSKKDKKKYFFKIGERNFYTQLIGSGGYGDVYKIQDAARKKPPVAMKVFYDTYEVSYQNIFSEIGLSKEVSRANVRDVPVFYMANPIGDATKETECWRGKGGWMITEYVSKFTPLKKQTAPNFSSFFDKLGLFHSDMNPTNAVGNYVVDLGGIESKKHENNLLVSFGPGEEISSILIGMRKGESAQDIIDALKKRLVQNTLTQTKNSKI